MLRGSRLRNLGQWLRQSRRAAAADRFTPQPEQAQWRSLMIRSKLEAPAGADADGQRSAGRSWCASTMPPRPTP
ncbi:hypothetical protein J4732_19785 [Serratia marcescens]|uniref:Uncharacterized protein n=1 Tax=Serratia marcescens TaxID=615 RepID=A0A939NQG7_SERMA|nr:hypothetical protein [Serratia marcescens]